MLVVRCLRRHLTRRLLIALAGIAVLFVVVALTLPIRAGGELTLDKYYDRLSSIRQEAIQQNEALLRKYPEALQTGAEITTAVEVGTDVTPVVTPAEIVFELPTVPPQQDREKLEELLKIIQRHDRNLANLRPPEEIKSLHDEYVAASRAFTSEFERLSVGEEDIDTAIYSLVNGDATRRFQDACLALRRYGLDRGIDVDLEC